MEKFTLLNVHICSPCNLFWWSFYGSMIIRLIISVLKAFEFNDFYEAFVTILYGFGGVLSPKDPLSEKNYVFVADYWRPFILGVLELFIYPILMTINRFDFIGAWLSFKTIGQWAAWRENRSTFNVFLIGNALVLFASYILAWLVPVCSCS